MASAARAPLPEAARAEALGPYRVLDEPVPGAWLVATDPVLRREVWLIRRGSAAPSTARRNLARAGRLRWLQEVVTPDATWDAFEAPRGRSLRELAGAGETVRWSMLRLWLHDLAEELGASAADSTLPAELSLDNVWITAEGRAILLDEPWPGATAGAERFAVASLAGRQRFLHAVAAHADTTRLPLHARPVLRNLERGKFEKNSFLTGTLRGLLERPAEVGRGVRAGSIFMLPLYVWVMIFVGAHEGAPWLHAIVGSSTARVALASALFVACCAALIQLLEAPFRFSFGHSIFRLAVIDDRGERAGLPRLLARWSIAWLPLLVPLALVLLLPGWNSSLGAGAAAALLLLWSIATGAVLARPEGGLHDRLAGTRVVRQ
jgi:hypothetical protein